MSSYKTQICQNNQGKCNQINLANLGSILSEMFSANNEKFKNPNWANKLICFCCTHYVDRPCRKSWLSVEFYFETCMCTNPQNTKLSLHNGFSMVVQKCIGGWNVQVKTHCINNLYISRALEGFAGQRRNRTNVIWRNKQFSCSPFIVTM